MAAGQQPIRQMVNRLQQFSFANPDILIPMRSTCLFLAALASSVLCSIHAQSPIDFNLEVEVVMDSVLYDDFGSVPEGFRRYRVYAVIPEGFIMLGPAADDLVTPPIPGFGYSAPCGCYDHESPLVPNGYDVGGQIQPALLALESELAFDSWWTAHYDQQAPGSTLLSPPGTFDDGFNMCSDQVVQGGILVTQTDPVQGQAADGRALIGQITTCDSFSFSVCVAIQETSPGEPILVSCTDGQVEVPDLCTPVHNAELTVLGNAITSNADNLPESIRYRVYDWNGDVVSEQYGNGDFYNLVDGAFTYEWFDTATTVAWSSNTCRKLEPFGVNEGGTCPLDWGCTFQQALNYDSLATLDNGSCIIVGCTSLEALNFNPYANLDDGSCMTAGCTEPDAINYNPEADFGDGSCVFVDCSSDLNGDGLAGVADLVIFLQNFGEMCAPVYGCPDPEACNYDPSIYHTADSVCTYPVIMCVDADGDGLGHPSIELFQCLDADVQEDFAIDCSDNCDDVEACNYADSANVPCEYLDSCGVCGGDGLSCVGCMDADYLEFDPMHTVDDGSCYYLIDIDCVSPAVEGHAYEVVQIGWQCWFAENLRSSAYANGDSITTGLDASAWSGTNAFETGAMSIYGGDPASCASSTLGFDACDGTSALGPYGRLYNGYAVTDVRGLCPSGWHVPSDIEWQEMEAVVGVPQSELDDYGVRGLVAAAGAALKTTSGWNGQNGNDAFGFSGLPGGARAAVGAFTDAGLRGLWWTSTVEDGLGVYRSLFVYNSGVFREDYLMQYGLSVRCIKD